MEVLCFRLLSRSKNFIKQIIPFQFFFNTTSGLNYTKFERDFIKWYPQSALNYSLKFSITSSFENCNRLHYFNTWNIHKFSYRNNKIIESDFDHFVFLNIRSIIRKLVPMFKRH